MPYIPNGSAFDNLFEAAREGRLHLDGHDAHWRVQWDNGWTLAHEAASGGSLPEDFKFWWLRDDRGVSVKDVHIMRLMAQDKKE
jgi:hypothetical protein